MPAALFANKRLVWGNRLFRQVFLGGSGKRPNSTTLKTFLGRPNASFLKELEPLTEADASSSTVLTKELCVPTRDQHIREYEVAVSPIIYQNKRALQFTFVDITGRTQALRKLVDSEYRLKSILENSPDAISMTQSSKVIFVNKPFLIMFGYASGEEVMGKNITRYASAKYKKHILERCRHLTAGSDVPKIYEYLGIRKDGSTVHVQDSVSTLEIDGIPTVLSVHRDVTGRKNLEEQHALEKKRLEIVHHVLMSINEAIDWVEILTLALEKCIHVLGYEFGAMYTTDSDGAVLTITVQHGLVEPLGTALHTQSVTEGITGYVMKTHEPLMLSLPEYPPHLPYRSLFDSAGVHSVVYIPLLNKGSISALMLLGTRKAKTPGNLERMVFASLSTCLGGPIAKARVYAQLKKAEERLRSAIGCVAEVVYECSPAGRFVLISPAVEHLLGYKPADFYSGADLFQNLMHPDDRSKYSPRFSGQSQKAESTQLEYRVLPRGKASYLWVRDSIRYQRDENDMLLSIHGTIWDVTSQKIAEENLRMDAEHRADILDNLHEGIVALDAELRYIGWNTAMEQMTGMHRSAVMHQKAEEITPGLVTQKMRTLLKRLLTGKRVSSEDIAAAGAVDDVSHLQWSSFFPLRTSDGAIRAVGGIAGMRDSVKNEDRPETDVRS